MSHHDDCSQEETIVEFDRRINDASNKTSNINGKMTVLLLIMGALVTFAGGISAQGFTVIDGLDERIHNNETSIEVILEMQQEQEDTQTEYQERMIKGIDRLLTMVEKVDNRVREIEIKQAEGQGRQ